MIQQNKFYIKGFQITIVNAKKLLSTADLSAKNKNFGIAQSLSILSAEEAIKASLILVKISDIEIEDFEDLFKKHQIKHNHLETVFISRKILLEFFNSINKEIKKLLNKRLKKESVKLQQATKKQFDYVLKINNSVNNQMKDIFSKDEIKDWWNEANTQKNNGFYVGLKNDNWIDPNIFSRVDFLKARKYTKSAIEFAELMFDLVNVVLCQNNS